MLDNQESKELEQKGGFSDKLLIEEAYESYYKAAVKAAARERQGKPPLNKSSWQSAIERFHSKYKIIDSSGCWDWKAKRMKNGIRNQMGSFFFNGIKIHANQASWILFRGAILKNMGVHHKCLLATCVNPDHLILMSHQESIRANAFTAKRKDLKELKELKEQLTATQQALDAANEKILSLESEINELWSK